MRFLITALCLLVGSLAHANGLEALDQFIKSTKNGQAEFIQTVTSPASSDGKAGKVKLSRGTFEFLRPNRFKFIYTKPFEQSIVADGQTLWLHDVDLNQVTARKLASVMAGSPAALFASAPNLQALQAEFTLQAISDKASDKAGSLDWVLATPKTKGKQDSGSLLQSVKVGFRQTASGTEIAQLEMIDSFGQTSVIKFDKVKINTTLSTADFNFKVPAGVDVIR
ncbi:MAG: outer membrane lipoprotein chaperone LolA [Cytophagales bacterium]|nr:outer membrane lipoprotein chaperone LolA [Cytophagales bacterium]